MAQEERVVIDFKSLAARGCPSCGGEGFTGMPCDCVYRRMFKACLMRYWYCRRSQRNWPVVCQEIKAVLYSRPAEEFMVDFYNVGRHALDDEPDELLRLILMSVFKELLKTEDPTDRTLSTSAGIALGQVHEALQHLAAIIGKRCFEVRPYPLYPLSAYFGVGLRRENVRLPKPGPSANSDGSGGSDGVYRVPDIGSFISGRGGESLDYTSGVSAPYRGGVRGPRVPRAIRSMAKG